MEYEETQEVPVEEILPDRWHEIVLGAAICLGAYLLTIALIARYA